MTVDVGLARRAEWWLVVLITLHTLAIGIGLLAAPEWALRFGGWVAIPPPFFPRQAGVFHLVLGTGYLLELVRLRGVTLLLVAKACGATFLIAATVFGSVPWFVTFAGVADGLMGLAVAALRLAISRAEARASAQAGAST